MKSKLRVVASVCAVFLLTGTAAQPCGDKLLVLGRGVRFQSGTQSASILLYVHSGSASSAALGDLKFQSALRDAGHKLQVVGSREELDGALKNGKYDIILTDTSDAAALETATQSAASKPVILPVVSNGTKAEAAADEKRFGCVLKVPGRTGHYLAAIDKAMELKSKRDRTKVVASR